MSLLQLPPEVLFETLARFLSPKDSQTIASTNSKLRDIFLPLTVRSIIAKESSMSGYLFKLQHHPHLQRHVAEFQMEGCPSGLIPTAFQILKLVGPWLERLTFQVEEVFAREECQGSWVVKAVELCPRLKSVDLRFANSSWWESGGGKDLAKAIEGRTDFLISIAVNNCYAKGGGFWVPVLSGLRPGQLKERLSISSHSEDTDAIVALASKQTEVRSLELLLYDLTTGAEFTTSTNNHLFHGFTKLESLNVTFKGFQYFAPAFKLCPSLKELMIGTFECYESTPWSILQETIRSGWLDGLESLTIFVEDCYGGDAELDFFRLLGGGTSMKSFGIFCSDHWHESDVTMPLLDNVFRDMAPNSNLTSVVIRYFMADSTLLHFARFVSKCDNLVSLRLSIPNREIILPHEEDRKQFLELVESAPKLKDLELPEVLRS
ncbi:hypothetical protein HDU67_008025 [Dinochytrium kinnereticum]|nr:hypothetical protein HDU67_008025 [Dinochytrium kinnereticum]